MLLAEGARPSCALPVGHTLSNLLLQLLLLLLLCCNYCCCRMPCWLARGLQAAGGATAGAGRATWLQPLPDGLSGAASLRAGLQVQD